MSPSENDRLFDLITAMQRDIADIRVAMAELRTAREVETQVVQRSASRTALLVTLIVGALMKLVDLLWAQK